MFDCLTIQVDNLNRVRNRVDIELNYDVDIKYLSRVTILISSIWIKLES
jgi:hypothetical protein